MDNMLSVLENYIHDNPDDISKSIADEFRKRRIEKTSHSPRYFFL